MFCNGLICLKRKTKCSKFVSKLSYLVLLDKIILVVFWPYAERLFLNGLLESCYIFVVESTKLRRKASCSEISPLGCRTMALRFIPGHRPFLLRPSLGTELSYYSHSWTQGFLNKFFYGFCQWQGWGTGLCPSKLSRGWQTQDWL